jgi:hypothetical protein
MSGHLILTEIGNIISLVKWGDAGGRHLLHQPVMAASSLTPI